MLAAAMLGWANGSNSLEAIFLVDALGAGALGVAAGWVYRHVLVALAASLLGSMMFTFVYVGLYASHIADEKWTESDTGLLLAFVWFPFSVLAMTIGAVVGWFLCHNSFPAPWTTGEMTDAPYNARRAHQPAAPNHRAR